MFKNLELLVKYLTFFGSATAFILTLYQWREQTNIKRAEFLESKIEDFENPKNFLARSILDSFSVAYESVNKTDEDIVRIGSSRRGYEKDIQFKNLASNLLAQLPDTSNCRQRVKLSFDHLLDFFGKLEYYHSLQLLTDSEILYFNYYLEKCSASPAILKYANRTEANRFLSLVERLRKNKKLCKT